MLVWSQPPHKSAGTPTSAHPLHHTILRTETWGVELDPDIYNHFHQRARRGGSPSLKQTLIMHNNFQKANSWVSLASVWVTVTGWCYSRGVVHVLWMLVLFCLQPGCDAFLLLCARDLTMLTVIENWCWTRHVDLWMWFLWTSILCHCCGKQWSLFRKDCGISIPTASSLS